MKLFPSEICHRKMKKKNRSNRNHARNNYIKFSLKKREKNPTLNFI